MGFVANPRITFNIVTSDRLVGLDDHRALIVGQIGTGGTASGGTLVIDLPRSDAEINEILGANGHAAMMARAFRGINKVSNLDVLLLADAGGAAAAAATIAFAGAATRAGTYTLKVVSEEKHAYPIDVALGDGPAELIAKIADAVAADRYLPFTRSDNTTTTTTFTAVNKGTHANSWLIALDGVIPGLTATLTAWSGGATNPSLTAPLDLIANIRYQTIVWPEAYTASAIGDLLDARKNVTNDVMEGRAFIYQNAAFATVKTNANALNSSEVVIFNNAPNAGTAWKGAHLPEAPDVLAAKFAAARALRFEDGASISPIVVTNAAKDQFGGIHTASLPYFNTPMTGVGQPQKGTGYSIEEQIELEGAGVSILGANRENNAVITGVVVTTYLNDAAGNVDDTWKYLEWRDTHGVIREFMQRNCQKAFRQHRMTVGEAPPNFSIINADAVRSFILLLNEQLAAQALTVAGTEARQFLDANLTITPVPAKRRFEISMKILMVSQFGEAIGSIKYAFDTNG